MDPFRTAGLSRAKRCLAGLSGVKSGSVGLSGAMRGLVISEAQVVWLGGDWYMG